ncbi:hypothetical protein [Aquirhabdus sp.]|uniref:hypothetical protein n=1 Tax=Aquirhabdus sp. TaxID=2824160 RepID=UPI00396C8BAE
MTMTTRKAECSTLQENEASLLLSLTDLAYIAQNRSARNLSNIAHDDGAHSRRLRSNTSNGNP